jgi:ferric iron reductase protein FhuF
LSSKATSKKKKAVMGQPPKREDEKILTNHLRPDQWKRLEEEATIRNKSTWAFIRECLDWTITALDTKRGDVEVSKLFDGVVQEVDKESVR